jgi:hypothetical protein
MGAEAQTGDEIEGLRGYRDQKQTLNAQRPTSNAQWKRRACGRLGDVAALLLLLLLMILIETKFREAARPLRLGAFA